MDGFFAGSTGTRLEAFITSEYAQYQVFPARERLFRALELCPLEQTLVVILGQDPYHGPGQANGLAFSVNPDQALPPTLANIFKELAQDLGRPSHADRSLEHWARQGVLLLNTCLTVREGEPGSHAGHGWEAFTDLVLKKLQEDQDHLVFVLWGNQAQKKGAFLDRKRHTVVSSPHPSPLSSYRGFFGSKPFSACNDALVSFGKDPIDW